MPEQAPSLEEWKGLYEAAVRLRELAPWEWMYDSDIFGVKNPYTGEVGYCCVLGRVYGTLGLVLYLGTEGLSAYHKTQTGKALESLFDILIETTALTCLFGSRNELHKRDLDIIKSLNLKFRGRDAWPLFRSCRPGYYPWFLTSDEARYFTMVLEQSIVVATRFRKDPDILKPPMSGHYFVRVPVRQNGQIHWTDSWLKPEPLMEPLKEIHVDDMRLRRVIKNAKRTDLRIEADLFNFPNPVMDKGDERPYFPRMALWVDQDSGLSLKFDLFDLSKENPFSESFLRLVETLNIIPTEVHLANKYLEYELIPIADTMGIKLTTKRRLRALEKAKKDLFKTIGGSW